MSVCGDFGGRTAKGEPCQQPVEDGQCWQHGEGKTGGRPAVEFTDEQVKQIEKLASVLNQDQIADFLGITDRTLRRKIHEDERVASAYKRGSKKAVAQVATNLIQQAREGNVTAAIFYLKTQGGWNETRKHEVTGPEGGPLDLTVKFVKADAEGDG